MRSPFLICLSGLALTPCLQGCGSESAAPGGSSETGDEPAPLLDEPEPREDQTSHTSTCTKGEGRLGDTPCGLNEGGVLRQLCSENAWNDTSECVDPDVCVNSETRTGSTGCGDEASGRLQQVCKKGQWTDSSECEIPEDCDATAPHRPGTTPCGDYLSGTLEQSCQQGSWVDTSLCLGGAPFSICQAGEYEKAAPTDTSDRICGACIAGQYCPGGESPLVQCVAGEACIDGLTFQDCLGAGAYNTSPENACTPWRTCSGDELQFRAGTGTQDRDCDLPLTHRVSVASDGTQADGTSSEASVSSGGRFTAFASSASNLVAGDTNGERDVFVHDHETGTTTRVSVSSGGLEANDRSTSPVISADGRFVAFASEATNLDPGDTTSSFGVFLHDRALATTTLVSVAHDGGAINSSAWRPSISDDGRFVAFYSNSSNLVPNDTNASDDVFVRDMQQSSTTLVSVTTAGIQGNDNSRGPKISGDGSSVVFYSYATNLAPGDDNDSLDVFHHRISTGTTSLLSVALSGASGNRGADYPSVSSDGRFATFQSRSSDLVADSINGSTSSIFLRDMVEGKTSLISLTNEGLASNGPSYEPIISADGTKVAFRSGASNLIAGDTNGEDDYFIRELSSPSTSRVSLAEDSSEANGRIGYGTNDLSPDGSVVVFVSHATNLVPNDTNAIIDVFRARIR